MRLCKKHLLSEMQSGDHVWIWLDGMMSLRCVERWCVSGSECARQRPPLLDPSYTYNKRSSKLRFGTVTVVDGHQSCQRFSEIETVAPWSLEIRNPHNLLITLDDKGEWQVISKTHFILYHLQCIIYICVNFLRVDEMCAYRISSLKILSLAPSEDVLNLTVHEELWEIVQNHRNSVDL